jgi:hypothetical protein
VAPHLWFEHLFEALKHPNFGLSQSSIDPCFLASPNLMVVCFVDDLGVSARSKATMDEFVAKLRSQGLDLEIEGSFEQYLGIKFERTSVWDQLKGQKRTDCYDYHNFGTRELQTQPNARQSASPRKGRRWRCNVRDMELPSVVGMLLHLSTNTRPDISLAVSQVGRFSSNPKQSFATAIKTIGRYLAGTRDKGMILKPRGDFKLEMICDADFAGLYKRDPDRSTDSVPDSS